MTSPVALADPALRLRTVAAWDVASLRGGLHAMTVLDEGFPAWRTRLDTVVRALEEDGYWSGPAAALAGGLLLHLSTEAAALDAGFAASREESAALVHLAGTAAERAATALTLARTLPVPLDAVLADDGRLAAGVYQLVPGPALVAPVVATAHEALAAAAVAEAAAARAEEALGPAPVAGPGGWPAALPPGMCRPPVDGDPAATARWWSALPLAAQLALVDASPGTVGSSDGVPAWARDRANRIVLREVIADPDSDEDERATARVVAELLATEHAAGRVAQLQLLDLAGDRVAVAFGDLDTADAVAVVVPGMNTTPADDLGGVSGDARDVAAAARRAAPGETVAAMAWLGYRAPQNFSVVSRRAATLGGARLDAAMTGLAAAHAAAGAPPSRTTVVAHSYGTVVVDEAADRPGRLAADAVVLLGSPGMEDDAASLEAPEVYDAASATDPVSWVGWFGAGTWSPAFGSTALPVEPGTGHSDYFDRDRPTLAAIGEVVVGRHD